jgi:hypothetical protein
LIDNSMSPPRDASLAHYEYAGHGSMQELSVGQRVQHAFARVPFETPQSLRLLDTQAKTGHLQKLSASTSKQRCRVGCAAMYLAANSHAATRDRTQSLRGSLSLSIHVSSLDGV